MQRKQILKERVWNTNLCDDAPYGNNVLGTDREIVQAYRKFILGDGKKTMHYSGE